MANDNWHQNTGIPPHAAAVNIRFRRPYLDDNSRSVTELQGELVSDWDWSVNNNESDIVAYQVIK